jgi:hypothetical protein
MLAKFGVAEESEKTRICYLFRAQKDMYVLLYLL